MLLGPLMPAGPGVLDAGVPPPSLAEMVTNGANRVAPHTASTTGVALFVLAIVLAATALRWNRRRGSATLVVALAALASTPGLYILATARFDSPARAETSAAKLDDFRDQVERFARGRGCAEVVRSRCEACEPVVRFALADVDPCAHPAAIVLGPDALRRGCHVGGDGGADLVCGTVSDDAAAAARGGAP